MFESSLQTGLLSVLFLGVAWPQEPVREPVARALALETYGVIDAPVGQLLKPSLAMYDGAPHLIVEGGEPFDAAFLLVGRKATSIALPWGDRIQVLPEIVLTIGSFDDAGRLAVVVPLRAEDLDDAPVFLQVFEDLRIDPHPWSLQSTPGIRFFAVEEERSAARDSGSEHEIDPVDVLRDEGDPDATAALVVFDELGSSRVEVWLEVESAPANLRFELDDVLIEDAGITTVRVALVSDAAEPGLGGARRLLLRVPLGTSPGPRIDVLLAHRDAGVHTIVPPPYRVLATLWWGSGSDAADREH